MPLLRRQSLTHPAPETTQPLLASLPFPLRYVEEHLAREAAKGLYAAPATSAPSCEAPADREPARLLAPQRLRRIPPTLGQARLLRHNRPLRDVPEELPQFPAPIPCVLPFSRCQCLYGQEFGKHRFLRPPYRQCETSHRGRQRGLLRACPNIPQTRSDRALLSLLPFQEQPGSRRLRPAEHQRSAAAYRRSPVRGRRVTGSTAPCQSLSYRSAPASYGC